MRSKRFSYLCIALINFIMWGSFMFKIFASNLAHLSRSLGEIAKYANLVSLCFFGILCIVGLLFLFKNGAKNTLKLIYPLIISGLLSWLTFGLIIYLYQNTLLFSPRTISVARLEAIRQNRPNAEEIWVTTEDGVRLQGWFVKKVQETPTPLAIFFAGQGGEASRYLELADRLEEFSCAFLNYRGYGLSEGVPSDRALFNDSLAIFDHLAQREDVNIEQVIAIGGSLGTGIATYLAAHRNLIGVILFSPYDRIGGGVTQDMLPFLPTSLLFHNKFDVLDIVHKISTPVLAIIGENDKVISPKRSLTLLKQWLGDTSIEIIPGDHYSIYEDPYSWKIINEFLASYLR